MKLNKLHTEKKDVQTAILLKTQEQGTVISLQIDANKQLKEHITKAPAVLVCVSGKAVYSDETGKYVQIPPNVVHKVDAVKKSNFILIK